MSDLLVGTATWTKPEWAGTFYPQGTHSRQFLPYYATRFRTVEVDSTWYHCPTPQVVEGWRERTPEGFVFSAKAPKRITHEKQLIDCEVELQQFLTVIRGLGDRLGPILFQLPYLRKADVPDLATFLARLEPFLHLLPEDLRFVIEIRNRNWLQPALFELLRGYAVALAWTDDRGMPGPAEWEQMPEALTADFLYVRLLGEHAKAGEPSDPDLPADDRRDDVRTWATLAETLSPRVERTYVYASQRFAGYAPGTAQLVRELWEERQRPTPAG